MSGRDVRVFGKRFSCPGCHARLKFQRPPTTLLHTCPSCRKVLKLQDRQAAASQDDELKDALDSLLSWQPEEPKTVEYSRDPRLDEIDESKHGIWQFNQPWPDHTGDMVSERVSVELDPEDGAGSLRCRTALLEGYHRRVTVFRTGGVEEIAVTGHWWEKRDQQAHDGLVGYLPRTLVRELNRIPSTPVFAARINCLCQPDSSDALQLLIDLAVDNTPKTTKKIRSFRQR